MKRSVFLALTAALLAGCTGRGGGGGGGAPVSAEHPLLGAPAPSFELPRQGGGRVSLSDAAGKVAIVDFWATWCEPCKASFPAYERLSKKYGEQLVVIGVSVDEDDAGIAQFASETGVHFPLAWDEGQRVSAQYQPPTMPTSFVVDASGIVRFVHAGFREGDERDIEDAVGSLLNR